MLFLTTGQPGNGKTLNTLVRVEALRLKEGRNVYQDGVGGLTLPWKPLPLCKGPFTEKEIAKGFPAEVPDWEAVPDGSIILIDEAWRFFPPRGQAGIAPVYVQFLAEHRHRGFDIFLVTQGRNQIDSFVRTLVGKHYHLDRRFGIAASRVWQWERQADPTSPKDKKEGQSSRWAFPVEAYTWYTSSVEHTHKKDLPWKKIALLGGSAFAVVFFAWFAIHNFRAQANSKAAKSAGGEGSAVTVGGQVVSLLDLAASYWGKNRQARVVGVPQSAPIYDPLQKVASQPRVEGCLQITRGKLTECRCSGPNGAVLDLPVSECTVFVKRGWFDETRKYDDIKQKNIDYLNSLDRVAGGGASGSGAVAAP